MSVNVFIFKCNIYGYCPIVNLNPTCTNNRFNFQKFFWVAIYIHTHVQVYKITVTDKNKKSCDICLLFMLLNNEIFICTFYYLYNC